jgi:hypothetical protein
MNWKKFFVILLAVWFVFALAWLITQSAEQKTPTDPQAQRPTVQVAQCDALASTYGEVSTDFVDRANDLTERVGGMTPERLQRVDAVVPMYVDKLSNILQTMQALDCDRGRFVATQLKSREDILSPEKRLQEYFPQGEFNQTKYCSEINYAIGLYASWKAVFNSENITEESHKAFLVQLFENQPPFAAGGHVNLTHDYLYLFTQQWPDTLTVSVIKGLTEQQIHDGRVRASHVAGIFGTIIDYQWNRHKVFNCPVDV